MPAYQETCAREFIKLTENGNFHQYRNIPDMEYTNAGYIQTVVWIYLITWYIQTMDVDASIQVKEHDPHVTWTHSRNVTLRDKSKLWNDVYNKPFMKIWNALKTNPSLRLKDRVKKKCRKENEQSRGPVWEDVMEGGSVKWMLKEKRTGQIRVLPRFLWEAPHQEAGRSCKGQCSGLDELYEAAVAPSSPGTKLQACSALSSVTSWREVHSLCPTESQALCPGSHKNARLCQVCGWYWPSRHCHTWKYIENLLGHFESTRQKTLRWVTDSDWNLTNSDGGWYLGRKNFSINHPVGLVTKKME